MSKQVSASHAMAAPGNLPWTVARAAAALAILYALPHLWWGLGIYWLAPGDMNIDGGLGSNEAIRLFAFYGMGSLAVLSAFLALDMERVRHNRFPAWFLALHGWAIGVLLILRGGIGLVETVLISSGTRDCPFLGCESTGSTPGEVGMTGYFWEPLFVTWGIVLLAATYTWHQASRH